jgi:hypothetical protein
MCHEREKLIEYVFEECGPAEKQAMDAHFESCAECRDEIRGLRRVRQDLLAWDVPHVESVWRPFAPPQTTAWWRQVPAWAMAAAAGVMFVCGLAGGLTAQVLSASGEPSLQATDLGPSAGSAGASDVVPAAFVSSDELTAAEQRILAMLRADLARVERGARQARAGAAEFDRLADEVTTLRARMDHGDLQGDVLRRSLQDLSERARRVEGGLSATNLAVERLVNEYLNPGGGGR